jgi:hypothetical protein
VFLTREYILSYLASSHRDNSITEQDAFIDPRHGFVAFQRVHSLLNFALRKLLFYRAEFFQLAYDALGVPITIGGVDFGVGTSVDVGTNVGSGVGVGVGVGAGVGVGVGCTTTEGVATTGGAVGGKVLLGGFVTYSFIC